MSIGGATKGFLQLVSANLVTKIMGLVALGLFTRYLTIEELAFLPVYNMPGALSLVIFGFGMQPTIIRKLPGLLKTEKPTAGRLIRMSSKLVMTGTSVFSIGVFLAAEPVSAKLLGIPDFAPLIRLTAVGSCFATWRIIFHQFLWAASRFDKIATVRTSAALGRTLLGIAGLLVGGVNGLAIGFVINDAFALILAIIYCRDMLRITPGPGFSYGSLIREALPFYFESYLTFLRNQGDNWVVATTLGPSALGIYFVAKRFPLLLTLFMESLDKVVTARLSRLRDDPIAISNSVNELLSSLSLLAVPGIFIVMGLLPTLTRIIAGPGFEAAILPGMILCMMQLGRVFVVPIGRGVFVTRPPLTRVLITAAESIVLIVSLLLFVPPFAETGVALSRVTASFASLFFGFVVLKKHLDIQFPWRQLAISLFISTAMTSTIVGGVMWNDSIRLAPLFIIAGVAVFLSLTWLFQIQVFTQALVKILPFSIPSSVINRFLRN